MREVGLRLEEGRKRLRDVEFDGKGRSPVTIEGKVLDVLEYRVWGEMEPRRQAVE